MTQKKQAPVAPIKTWRERIGAGPDFPVHAPTDVERAMQAEIAELRARRKAKAAPEVGRLVAGYRGAVDIGEGSTIPVVTIVEVNAAARDVLAERRRQLRAEGITNDGDDCYQAAELPRAAASYILHSASDVMPYIWPWAKSWWKPRDARRNYVRAAALLLAEIERIDRAAATKKETGL